MTLTGMKNHVGVLEAAGLITTEKVGRVRTCRLGPRGLEAEAAWIESHRQVWDARFDELDNAVKDLKRKEKFDGRQKRCQPNSMKNRTPVERSQTGSWSLREPSTAPPTSCSRRGPSLS